jgi:hypothetical protein
MQITSRASASVNLITRAFFLVVLFFAGSGLDHADWRVIVDTDQRVMPAGELVRMILDIDANLSSILKQHLAAVSWYAQHMVVVVHQ